MKASSIQIGKTYELSFGVKRTSPVRIVSFDSRNGTWTVETYSGKMIPVKEAKRFLKEIKPKTEPTSKTQTADAGPQEEKQQPMQKMSGLNAAFKVLLEEARPMTVKEITELAQERGYCDLPGLTPSATVSAAIQRDIKTKGEASRFIKVTKGQFSAR